MSGDQDISHAQRKRKLLIVDDHPLIRAGLIGLISAETDMEVCGHAGGINEALKIANETKPDVLIVDLSLPDGSGLTLIKRLRTSLPDAKTLVCSMHDESVFALRALNAGARGYINKQEATQHVVSAIHRVLDGEIYLSARMTEQLQLNAAKNGSVTMGSSIESLSDREIEVFEMIGQCKGTSEIAYNLHVSVKTIETHRENIKKKLRLNSGPELVHRAIHWVLNGS